MMYHLWEEFESHSVLWAEGSYQDLMVFKNSIRGIHNFRIEPVN